MIPRDITPQLITLSRQYPVVALTGTRQSGKTTLAQNTFKGKAYVNLEHLETREFALNDPVGFLRKYPDGAVIDEVQRAPDLFSYIQCDHRRKSKPNTPIKNTPQLNEGAEMHWDHGAVA